MVIEYTVVLEGVSHPVVISDEPEALLAAKAAGRAIIGVDGDGNDRYNGNVQGAAYVIPGFEDATEELAELVLRRHLGLPWTIEITERLVIRELVKEDAGLIPEEEYGAEEAVFRSPELLSLYIEKQYGFYEYGTWALLQRGDGVLVGIAGVSNPRLPGDMGGVPDPRLPGDMAGVPDPRPPEEMGEGIHMPWLELGYHIFRPFRGRGYGAEAVAAIADYSHEVLGVRLCALIHRGNLASRRIAEGLGMVCVMETGTESSSALLLYAENPAAQPDKADL